jgi:hypothetical protein
MALPFLKKHLVSGNRPTLENIDLNLAHKVIFWPLKNSAAILLI